MSTSLAMVLMCAAVCLVSILLSRLCFRINRHGYVPGSLIATIVPIFLVFFLLGKGAQAYLPPSLAHQAVLAMLASLGVGMIAGWVLARFFGQKSNDRLQ